MKAALGPFIFFQEIAIFGVQPFFFSPGLWSQDKKPNLIHWMVWQDCSHRTQIVLATSTGARISVATQGTFQAGRPPFCDLFFFYTVVMQIAAVVK